MAHDLGSTISGASIAQSTTSTVQLLPVDKVFPIKVGSEVFRISGNALNSDSPSYFTQFFAVHGGENPRTLCIDRDPVIFKDIVRHLQGYFLTPRDEEHFVYLYSDAIYYRLSRLRQRLFRNFYIRIGDTSFQVPRELFNEGRQNGDSKNFFSMGFASTMGSPFPDDKMFPQLNTEGIDAEKHLRPPHLIPPKLSRSSTNFDEILKYMEGYDIEIRSDIHRKNLIKDAKFYNLRHLSESLVPTTIYHNPFRGNVAEILLSVNDFRASNSRIEWIEGQPFGWMEYKRAHDVDKEFHYLVVQINDDGTILGGGRILLVSRQAAKSIKILKEAAEGRKSETHSGALLGGQQQMAIKIEIPDECYCLFDGEEMSVTMFADLKTGSSIAATTPEDANEGSAPKKRKLNPSEPGRTTKMESTTMSNSSPKAYILKRSMWRVKVRTSPSSEGPTPQSPSPFTRAGKCELVLVAVKLEGWTREREFSKEISWL